VSREERLKDLIALIEPLVENKGYELVKLEYASGKQGKLHLIIDHEQGIAVEDCELVSRAVSELLDHEDPIEHAYTLEVSSPGLERPLTKIKHFARFTGETVKIRTAEKIDGRDKYAGTLTYAGPESIKVDLTDGGVMEIPYDLISKANLWFIKPAKK